MTKKISLTSKSKILSALSLLILLTSCAESFDSPSQYSNVGFDKGRRADDATNTIPNLSPPSAASVINSVSPGYYTDGNQDFSSQGAKEALSKHSTQNQNTQQPQQPQTYYQQAPQGYYAQPQPYYHQPVPVQQAPAGYYAQPTYAPAYQPQIVPASRFYTNPYAIPPSAQAPQYYDSDQYYTAPTYYRNDVPQSSMQRRQ